jgi:hypothetical protein
MQSSAFDFSAAPRDGVKTTTSKQGEWKRRLQSRCVKRVKQQRAAIVQALRRSGQSAASMVSCAYWWRFGQSYHYIFADS